MEIGAAKCSVMAILKGHLTEANVITLSSNDLIAHLPLVGAYKYLGILLANNFKHQQMWKDLLPKYKWRVSKLLHSQLFSRNFLQH